MPGLRQKPEFVDRRDAGHRLAPALDRWHSEDVVVLGLPRGGVPVAAEVASTLRAPLDIIVVRKLGVPWQPELAMGAVGEGGVRVLNDDVVSQAGLTESELASIVYRESREVERKAATYRGDRPGLPLDQRTVVIVDDGIATGATARAACQVAREHGAALVVLAVPVAPKGWERNFVGVADHCACLETPTHFHAVGLHYKDFSPTSDAQVQSHLEDQQLAEQHLTIESDGSLVQGVITSPASTASRGLVVFAHGTGSSHRSPRNRFVARHLTAAGFTAALFDLVAADEGLDGGNDFDLPKLTERLLHMTWSLQQRPALAGQPLGFFGASTGAAVALGAAARLGDAVGAIVARGGRPDLARSALGQVTAPTLLVVGAADPEVVELNERARGELTCRVQLHVVPGATHVFAEPGALDAVADLTARWFGRYLPR